MMRQAIPYDQLWFQVLIATIAGIALGHWAPNVGASLKPLGDGFIALIRMMIAPVIFCTVVHGIASANDMKSVGRLAIRSLIYFEVITILALVMGLIAVNLWQPGVGMNVDLSSLDAKSVEIYVATAHEQSITGYFLHIIPKTFISAFTEGEVLQILFVSCLFGMAVATMGEKGRPIADMVEHLSAAFFKIIHFLMYLSPIGAFGAIAFTVGKFGSGSLVSLGELIIMFFALCIVFTVVVLGTVARIVNVSLWALLVYMRDEIILVAATTSTETVLPRVIEKMRGAGCDEKVVGFVVPAGYSFNLDGTCLYLTVVAVFLAQATNTPLGIWDQLALLAVLLLTSKGAAGAAGWTPRTRFTALSGSLSTAI